jgi:hypothetical protein
MRYLYDSTNIQDDPASAHLVAYYIDGEYATSAAALRTRFPTAILVPISAVGTNAGVVGDVEPGCMTINQGVQWVKTRRAMGVDPTIYCNELNGWSSVRAAFRAAGVAEPHYWVADYDGIAVLPAGAVAKQYANPTLTHGHFDLSVVADYWPGVDGQYSGGTTAIGDDMSAQAEAQIQTIYNVLTTNSALASVINDTHALVQKLSAPAPAPASVDSAAILAAIADLKAHPSYDPADASTLAIVTRIENALKGA